MLQIYSLILVRVTMNQQRDEEDGAEDRQSPRGRKRERKPHTWAKKKSKVKRDSGQTYVSRATQQRVEAREIGQPCRDGCFTRLTMPVIEHVFREFWEIGDYNLQNSYLQRIVEVQPVKKHRKSTTSASSQRKRTHNLNCTVRYGSTTYKVCKTGFQSIFGLKRGRLESAVKMVTTTGTTLTDRRGKHGALKVSLDQRNRVKEHIESLPTISNHYQRARAPHRRYLDSNLSVVRLYGMYKAWMDEHYPEEPIVKDSYYRKVFSTYNIFFKTPKADTCSTCDQLSASITRANNENEVEDLKAKLQEHKLLASEGQELMKHFSSNTDADTRVVCVDLQETQPIPRMNTCVAFYKRKMWLYNLCVHDLKKNRSTFFVWDEVTAGRGAVEIAAGMRKWLDSEYATGNFSKLIIFSDNCFGQNKNIKLITFYLRELHSSRLQSITHYYLVSGHSYMACDRAFGHIERKIRQKGDIYDLETYCHIIKTAVKRGYELVKLQQHDFLDIEALKQHIVIRKPQAPYMFAKARRFDLTSNYCEGYSLGMGYGDNTPMAFVRLMPTARAYDRLSFNLFEVPLQPKYPQPLRLRPAKTKDLLDLLRYIPSEKSQFLEAVVMTQQSLQQQQNQEVPSHEEDEDLLDYDSS